MKRGIPAGVAITAIVSAMLSSPIAVAAPSGVRILSASWGLNNGTGCPGGERGLDNIPVTFDWYIRDSSIDVGDFLITRDDGSTTNHVVRNAGLVVVKFLYEQFHRVLLILRPLDLIFLKLSFPSVLATGDNTFDG